jgi:cytochrome c oxidase cbb3-type subunit III
MNGSRRLPLVAVALALASCEREDRLTRTVPPSGSAGEWVRLVSLQPGTPHPVEPVIGGAESPVENEYEENAFALSEGKRLYSSFNCVGCHAHGGGGMGPPLMDEDWIYGSAPEQIFSTIVEGRPNGMPSWGGRIPEHQIWQLAAYVRSMGGLVPQDAAPARDDDMDVGPPEHSRERREPVEADIPPSAEMPQ